MTETKIKESQISDLGHIVEIQKDGAIVVSNADTINFSGSGVSVTSGAGIANVTISGGGAGASAFLDLTDVDEPNYTGHASEAVVVNTGEDGLEFAVVSGGGSATPDFTTWSPLPEPSSPSSHDDEFDDSSFDTGTWTEFDQDGELTITEDARGLVLTNTGSSFDITGAYQTAPTWGSSDGDGYTIYTKVAGIGVSHGSGNNYAGIAFWEGTTSSSDIDVYGLFWSSAGGGIRGSYYTDYDSLSTDFLNPTIYSHPEPTTFWLRVRCLAIDFIGITYYYYFDFSNDGISWMEIHQRERDFAPAQVGLFIASDYSSMTGNETPRAVFSMFRVDETNVYMKDAIIPGGARINGYIAT